MKSNKVDFASTLGSTSKTQDAVLEPLHTDMYHGAFLEITLNPPRTKAYLNAPVKTQKSALLKVFRRATTKFVCSSEYVYEYCKDGQVHLHGSMLLKDAGVICGLIQDIAKIFLSCFKQSNKVGYYNSNWMRFRAPCCCIQFRYKPEDIKSWKEYMNKQQIDYASPKDESFGSAFSMPEASSSNIYLNKIIYKDHLYTGVLVPSTEDPM